MASKSEITLQQVKIEQLKRAVKWKNAFGTDDGKECLDLLRKEFYDCPVIATSNPTETTVRAAQRDLVRYVIDNIEFTGE